MNQNHPTNFEAFTREIAPANISVFAWQRLQDRMAHATERIADLESGATQAREQIQILEQRLKKLECRLDRRTE